MRKINIKQGVNFIDLREEFNPLRIFERMETRKRVREKMKEALKPSRQEQERAREFARKLMLQLADRYERE